jgi:hypothetical protein
VAQRKKLSGKLTALQLEFILMRPGWASTVPINHKESVGAPDLHGAPLKNNA